MATSAGYSLDLGLDDFPDPTAVPANLYDAMVTVYQAIRSVALSYDTLAGLKQRTYEEYANYWNTDYREFNNSDRVSAIYLIAGEPVVYGNVIEVRSDGKAYKSLYFFFDNGVGNGITGSVDIGIAAKDAAAGEVLPVFTMGFIGGGGIEGYTVISYEIPAGSVAYPPPPGATRPPIIGEVFKNNILFTGAG